MQKIYNWCTQFSKAALDAVVAHWTSDAKYCNPQVCKDYVEEALSPGLPFMYGRIEPLDDLGTIQVHGVCKQGNLLTLFIRRCLSLFYPCSSYRPLQVI